MTESEQCAPEKGKMQEGVNEQEIVERKAQLMSSGAALV